MSIPTLVSSMLSMPHRACSSSSRSPSKTLRPRTSSSSSIRGLEGLAVFGDVEGIDREADEAVVAHQGHRLDKLILAELLLGSGVEIIGHRVVPQQRPHELHDGA